MVILLTATIILGVILGLLFALLVLLLTKKFESSVQHFLNEPLGEAGNKYIRPQGYFIGMSEDEELQHRDFLSDIKTEEVK